MIQGLGGSAETYKLSDGKGRRLAGSYGGGSCRLLLAGLHLASPNNLNETKYALERETSRLGCFSTFIWEYPGYNEEKKRFSDMFRTMGILAAKKTKVSTA